MKLALHFIIVLLLLASCSHKDTSQPKSAYSIPNLSTASIKIALQTNDGICKIDVEGKNLLISELIKSIEADTSAFSVGITRNLAAVHKRQVVRNFIDKPDNSHKTFLPSKKDSNQFEPCGCQAPRDKLIIKGKSDSITYVLFCNQVKQISGGHVVLLQLSDRTASRIQNIWNVIRMRYSRAPFGCSTGDRAYPLIYSDIYVNGNWRPSMMFCDISYAIKGVLLDINDSLKKRITTVKIPLFFNHNKLLVGDVIAGDLTAQSRGEIMNKINKVLDDGTVVERGDTIRVTCEDFRF